MEYIDATIEAVVAGVTDIIDACGAQNNFKTTNKDNLIDMFRKSLTIVLTASAEREQQLIDRIKALENRPATAPQASKPPNMATLFKSNSPEQKEERCLVLNAIARDNENRQSRENNIIISGMKQTSTPDSETVKNFFQSAGAETVQFTNVKRLRSGNKSIVNQPPLLLVSFTNPKDRVLVLKHCSHHKLANYEGVFVREDRTPEQQTEFTKLNEMRKQKNSCLEAQNLLDKPYRYIIHRNSGTVKCINSVESAQQNKCIFVSSSEIKKAIGDRSTTDPTIAANNKVKQPASATANAPHRSPSIIYQLNPLAQTFLPNNNLIPTLAPVAHNIARTSRTNPPSQHVLAPDQQHPSRLPIIVATNLRSIRNKLLYFSQFLDDHEPHIAFITETWLTAACKGVLLAEFFDNCKHSYNFVSSERENQNGGGTLILVRREYSASITLIQPKPIDQQSWFNAEGAKKLGKIELTIARTRPPRLPFGYSCCLLVCVYLPEYTAAKQRSSINQLINAIEDAVINCTSANQPLIYIAGDFNGADVKPVCSRYNLRQLNSDPTHIAGKCLDLILTNAPFCYNIETLLPIGPPCLLVSDRDDRSSDESELEDDLKDYQPRNTSDHNVVKAFTSLLAYKATRQPRRKIIARTGNLSATTRSIYDIDFDQLLAPLAADPQRTISNVYELILAAQDFHQPLRTIKVRGDKEWMTTTIKTLIQERQRAPTDEIKRAAAHRVSVAIKRRKYAYYKSQYSASKASMWKQAAGLRAPVAATTDIEGFGAKLNNQFSDKVWENIIKPDLSSYLVHQSSHLLHPDFPAGLQLFNSKNVAEQFAKIGSCTAGPDMLSGKLLCAAKGKLIPVFVKIFNTCIMYSICPTEWSSANITAIPKIPNASDPSDFRPIAITSAVSKMLERIIAKYILEIARDVLHDNNQYGFLPGRCTMDAIIQVLDNWGSALDHKDKMLAIFFDFAKAFDLVCHIVLLEKLRKILPAWLVSWIAAYLTNRRQRVRYNGQFSDWKDVRAGVIQGSVLGPVLFLLFISDINSYMPNGINILKYADDILAYVLGDFNVDLPQAIVKGVQDWCTANKMRLNTTKCKLLSFGISDPRPQINLNGTPLDFVDSYKYLGIELNTRLDPSQQWQRVSTLVSSLPYLFKKLKCTGWTKPMLLNAYRAYGLSHFTYSAVVLMSCTMIDKAEMTRFQNRILKIIGISAAEASMKHKIIPITSHIDKACARMFERIISEPTHPITSALKRNPRKPEQFLVPAFATAAYRNSFLATHLRTRRDGRPDLYTNNSANHT